MTQPRFAPAQLIVMLTRRSVQRTHLFRPDSSMTNAYAYLLAWASQKHSVKVIAGVLMSTHEHLIIQAPDGLKLAAFIRDLHRLVALTTKAYRKWDGAVWDHQPPSIVQLRTPQAVAEKIAYVMANPVAAGCVDRSRLWPGLTTTPEQLGSRLTTAKRPNHFLNHESGKWPESLDLDLHLPEAFGLDLDQLKADVVAVLQQLEAEARHKMKREQRKWIGVKRLLTMSPFRKAQSPEPLSERNPTFAVGKGQWAAFLEAVTELRTFRNAYRRALAMWCSGNRDAAFPLGTIVMVGLHRARTAPG